MNETIDTRGLSCPQPVLDTLKALGSRDSGKLVVLVDTEAAKENVSRAVQAKGWTLDSVIEEAGEYRLDISKA